MKQYNPETHFLITQAEWDEQERIRDALGAEVDRLAAEVDRLKDEAERLRGDRARTSSRAQADGEVAGG